MTKIEFETELSLVLQKHGINHIKAVTYASTANYSIYPYIEGGNLDSLPSIAQKEALALINRFVKANN